MKKFMFRNKTKDKSIFTDNIIIQSHLIKKKFINEDGLLIEIKSNEEGWCITVSNNSYYKSYEDNTAELNFKAAYNAAVLLYGNNFKEIYSKEYGKIDKNNQIEDNNNNNNNENQNDDTNKYKCLFCGEIKDISLMKKHSINKQGEKVGLCDECYPYYSGMIY